MPPLDPNNRQIPTQVRPLPKAPAEPLQGTPYDFIMTASPKPAKAGLNLKGGPKLLYIAGGGVALVIITFIILSLTSGSSSTPALVAVAQQQAEIVRVADLHYSDLNSSSVKNFTINTEASVASNQSEYLAYLANHGAKISDKQIALGTNPQTDAALDAAQASGALDSTVKETLQTALESYQRALQAAYQSSSSDQTKALLNTYFEQTKLLLEQSKS